MTNKQNIIDVLSKISASLEKQNDLQQESLQLLKDVHFNKDKSYGIIQNCAKAISIANESLEFYGNGGHYVEHPDIKTGRITQTAIEFGELAEKALKQIKDLEEEVKK